MKAYATYSLFLAILLSPTLTGQTRTYMVTTNGSAYFLDGEESPTIELWKDSTYTFQASGLPTSHPFAISTSSSAVNVPSGVTPSSITGNNTLTFTPTSTGTFFYVCTFHFFFGQITVVNAPTSTHVATQAGQVAETYALHANFPNPFNPSTRIAFDIPERSTVTISVLNILGQEVSTLFTGTIGPGAHHITWTANNPSGVYYYRLEAVSLNSGKRFQALRRMVLLK